MMVFYYNIFMLPCQSTDVYLITFSNGCDFSSQLPIRKALAFVELSTLITFPDIVVLERESQWKEFPG